MKRVLALLFPLALIVGCSPSTGGAGPEAYELLHIEGNVAGPRGERSYRVDGDRVAIVVRDAQQRVVEERARVLSASEREAAAVEVSRALDASADLVCFDAPEYRLTVDEASREPREVVMFECFPDEVAPFRELESILAG